MPPSWLTWLGEAPHRLLAQLPAQHQTLLITACAAMLWRAAAACAGHGQARQHGAARFASSERPPLFDEKVATLALLMRRLWNHSATELGPRVSPGAPKPVSRNALAIVNFDSCQRNMQKG